MIKFDSSIFICYNTLANYYSKKSSRFSKKYRIATLLISFELMKGVIKKLTDKGFGFIAPEGEEKDLFFHSNALVDVQFNELREGDAVTFESERSPKGMNAVNVRRA